MRPTVLRPLKLGLPLAAVIAAFLGPVAVFAEDAPAPEYGIKRDEPVTGTRLRDWAVTPGSLPVNFRYDQLSLEDRRKLRRMYEALPESDEPPFPADGLKTIFEPISKINRKRLGEGPLLLVATVGPSGDVDKVEAVGSPDPQLTKAASEVLLLTKFKPARCAGQPCAMEFAVRLQFTLKDGRP